ncbi:uncharacterized protein [Arachis hypogaea]|uniref:uncharacterized protein n=1 Tax=Arachis hypogaea TaxID=3818 RepID=UPI003B21A01D
MIEAETLATITAQRSRKFLYKNIVTRFGVPHSITMDNGTQFTDSAFKILMASLKIKHQFTSIEYPQANGQAEAANEVVLARLKCRLQDTREHGQTSFFKSCGHIGQPPTQQQGNLLSTYDIEAMIPIEVNEESPRVRFYDEVGNIRAQKEELDLLPEVREQVRIKE